MGSHLYFYKDTKKFDGKTYRLAAVEYHKQTAAETASKFRRDGLLVRVVHKFAWREHRYYIWARKK